MRKQYHFRPSQQGYYAWDVDRLVELTKNMEPLQVKLDSIQEIEENFRFSGPNDHPTCRAIAEHTKLIQEADLTYPIILSSDGRIMDGMHRVLKALLAGNNKIKAVKFNRDPKPDYENVYPDDLPYGTT